MKKVLIVVNIPKFFLSHWLNIALTAKLNGYDVHVATMEGPETALIKKAGLTHHVIPLNRSGQNILQELASLWSLCTLFKSLRPELIHLITIKPVIYGGIAARIAGVNAVLSAVTGLGYVFINEQGKTSTLRKLVSTLYRFVFGHPNIRVLFENEADCQNFCKSSIVQPEKTVVVHGAGVDLSHFSYVPEPEGRIKVVFAARLLKDKGVVEFLAAAGQLSHLKHVDFILAGDTDPDNPASLSEQELLAIKANGQVQVLGFCQDVASLFKSSHIIVLPSYREGLPKVLIEAAACGRAVITSDVPGCRHVIVPEKTGSLVPVKDVDALAKTMKKLIEDDSIRQEFGRAGRLLAESRFGEQQIGQTYMKLYSQLLAESQLGN
jgi:glycosyltransferase involved in cell wall biosynthesis